MQSRAGLLLIDPGLQDFELGGLADDQSNADQAAVAASSTHPDWDHYAARVAITSRYSDGMATAGPPERLADSARSWRSAARRA